MDILVDHISVNHDWNCRGPILLSSVKDLAATIKRSGKQLQEVVVTPFDGDKPYRLIAGFRRYVAIAQLLKWKTIRANVVEVSEQEARELNLAENLERESLNCLQEARALEKLFPKERYGCRHVSEALKKTTEWVLCRRMLLDLPEELQAKFASGLIPISRIRVVKDAPDPAQACQELMKRKHVRAPMLGMRRRKMGDIKRMIARLLDAGFDGLPVRLLSWVNGYISDEQLNHEIDEAVKRGRDPV